jgi:hypothetical protein
MLGAQRVLAHRGECRRPVDALARFPAQAAARTYARALPPSKTAARVSGGALPMAQRFFTLSGMTPLTCVVAAGSGAR